MSDEISTARIDLLRMAVADWRKSPSGGYYDNECATIGALIAEYENRDGSQGAICFECGPLEHVDEDGCCNTCGRDSMWFGEAQRDLRLEAFKEMEDLRSKRAVPALPVEPLSDDEIRDVERRVTHYNGDLKAELAAAGFAIVRVKP